MRVAVMGSGGLVGVVDGVMLCVKLWDTEAALQQLRPLVGPPLSAPAPNTVRPPTRPCGSRSLPWSCRSVPPSGCH